MKSGTEALVADALDRPMRSHPAPLPLPTGHNVAAPRDAWPVAILGVPFDPVTADGALDRIDRMIASREPHYVVTANVDFLVQARADVELRRILLDADLVLCDGTPLLWASRWLGNPLPERVAGSDLAPHLIRRAAEKGHRLFFLGAAPGVAEEAGRVLRRQYPNLNIVGTYAPPFAHLLEMNHDEIRRRIRAAKPDILLVSLGCPKQEKWISMHYRSLGVPVAIGVGATIDFLAGRVKRAPKWMRHSGTEWLYRLVQEPRRLFRRYASDLMWFMPALAGQWFHVTTDRAQAGGPRELPSSIPDWCSIVAGAQLTRRSLDRDAAFWRDATGRVSDCLVDVSDVRRVDSTGIALLMQWRKRLLKRGHRLVLVAPSPPVRRTLAALRLADHFIVVDSAAESADASRSMQGEARLQRDGTMRSIAWCGEIVAANAEDVWRTTADHLAAFAAEDVTLVIVDLSRLRFIDSSGVAPMLRLKHWGRQRQVEVLFTGARTNVLNVLKLTRVDQHILEGAQ